MCFCGTVVLGVVRNASGDLAEIPDGKSSLEMIYLNRKIILN
jgi:hypothetical protein